VRLTLRINGQAKPLQVEPRTTLLNALRNHANLTGAKLVCDRGSCGACTVMVEGKPVYSCMMLAVDAQGKAITTVEGLGTPEKMDPVQEAFVENDALMCGFCTPGLVMSVRALLNRNPNPTLEQVKEACCGNLCRCGTYPRVFDAALAAARTSSARREG
jgi:aerobic-type carbon monoxide dehydrogenase small subunit (CoxS/CutS family)